jgi:hypothetical protein
MSGDHPEGDADAWLRRTLNGYVTSTERTTASCHHPSTTTTAPTATTSRHRAGEHVAARRHPERIDHYALLRTIEDCHSPAPLGKRGRPEPPTLQ